MAYRRQLVRDMNGPVPSEGGWRGAPARATAWAARPRTRAGGATAQRPLPGRKDSLDLNTNKLIVLITRTLASCISVCQSVAKDNCYGKIIIYKVLLTCFHAYDLVYIFWLFCIIISSIKATDVAKCQGIEYQTF